MRITRKIKKIVAVKSGYLFFVLRINRSNKISVMTVKIAPPGPTLFNPTCFTNKLPAAEPRAIPKFVNFGFIWQYFNSKRRIVEYLDDF